MSFVINLVLGTPAERFAKRVIIQMCEDEYRARCNKPKKAEFFNIEYEYNHYDLLEDNNKLLKAFADAFAKNEFLVNETYNFQPPVHSNIVSDVAQYMRMAVAKENVRNVRYDHHSNMASLKTIITPYRLQSSYGIGLRIIVENESTSFGGFIFPPACQDEQCLKKILDDRAACEPADKVFTAAEANKRSETPLMKEKAAPPAPKKPIAQQPVGYQGTEEKVTHTGGTAYGSTGSTYVLAPKPKPKK